MGIDLMLHKTVNCAGVVSLGCTPHSSVLNLLSSTSLHCGSVLAGDSAFQREVGSDMSWVVGLAALSQGFVIKKTCLPLTEKV